MQTDDIHEIIEMLKTDPKYISVRFDIPLRTVYSWCSGERRPPDYVFKMMRYILNLERRIFNDGNSKEKLGSGMESNKQRIKKACKESKSEIGKN